MTLKTPVACFTSEISYNCFNDKVKDRHKPSNQERFPVKTAAQFGEGFRMPPGKLDFICRETQSQRAVTVDCVVIPFHLQGHHCEFTSHISMCSCPFLCRFIHNSTQSFDTFSRLQIAIKVWHFINNYLQNNLPKSANGVLKYIITIYIRYNTFNCDFQRWVLQWCKQNTVN